MNKLKKKFRPLNVGILGIKGIPAKGGSERVVEEIVTRLRNKIRFTIYSMQDYVPDDFQLKGVRLVRLRCFRGKLLKPVIFLILSVFEAFKASEHDIIHVHNAEAGFILPLLRLRYNRIISTAHGPGYDRTDKWNALEILVLRLVEILFVRGCNVVTAVKRALADYYARRYRVDSRFIPNGVDRNPMVNRHWLPDCLIDHGGREREYILFITGRVLPTKGPHVLLEAIKRLKPNIVTLLVGGKGYFQEYDDLLERMMEGLDNVFYHPLISDKCKVLGLMARCRLLVFPSSVEAMSMVLLEAASLGTPVVCSDIPENVEVMGENAIYFRVNDSKDLAKKLDYALKNRKEIEQQALLLRDTLVEEQSWDTIANIYRDIYFELAHE